MTRLTINLFPACLLSMVIVLLVSSSPGLTSAQSEPDGKDRSASDSAVISEANRLRAEQTKEANLHAVTKLHDAAEEALRTNQIHQAARALREAGEVSQILGNDTEAIKDYKQAITLAQKSKTAIEEGRALNDLGYLLFIAGNTSDAQKNCSRALQIGESLSDKSLIAQSKSNIAETYYNIGDFSKAISLQEKALDTWRALKDMRGQAQALVALGYYHANLADPKNSQSLFLEALSLSRTLNDLRGQALALIAISFLKVKVAEPQDALNALYEARQLIERIGDRTSLATVIGRLGFINFELGEYEKALEFASESIKLFEQNHQKWGAAELTLFIGRIHHRRGEDELALKFCEESLQLFRELSIPRLEAQTRQEIGLVYSALKDQHKAIDSFQRALSLLRPNQDYQRRAYVLNDLGKSYENQKIFDKAQKLYQEALQQSRLSSDQAAEILTLHNLAHGERAVGNLDRACKWLEEAISQTESLRAKVMSQDLRSSYLATVRQTYELYIDVLMQLDANHPGNNFRSTAFAISEKARARSLLEALYAERTNIREGVDQALLEKERALSAELNLKADRQIRLIAQQDQEEASKVEKEISLLTKEYTAVQDQIRLQSPRYAALALPEPLDIKDVQTRLVDSNSILLEYALGDERSYLWLVSKSGVETVQLPARKQIEGSARKLYGGIVAKQPSESDQGSSFLQSIESIPTDTANLSELLLDPLKGKLGNKRLIVIADGALQYIPFQALNDPDSNPGAPNLLLQNHEIVYEPSASTLAVLLNEASQRKAAPNSVAVLADPVFEVDDPRVKRASTESTPESEESKQVKKALRDIGISADGVAIPRLYASSKEADAIIRFAPWGTSLKAVGFDANRARIVGPELSNYRVVHFATHGLINNEHPELSGIVFSLFNQQGQSQDGFLRLHDIYNLHLPADLVVLSACSTGLGKDVRGEGLISLTRGFMYAGASGVVASLWKVDDDATAELMKLFYEGMFKKGLSPAAALREAQLSMSQQKAWQSPYYWAGFVIQGRYDEKVSGNQLSYLTTRQIAVAVVVIVSLLLLIIVVFRRRRRRTI